MADKGVLFVEEGIAPQHMEFENKSINMMIRM
jgi:hypothetical protein